MKSLTISMPEQIHRRARIRAAEHESALSSLVRVSLCRFASKETDFERGRRMQREVMASIKYFSASDRLTRDEIYDRSRK